MFIQDASNENDYDGPERRLFQRRRQVDRRQTIRFNLSDCDRRKNNGRRLCDRDHWRHYAL